MSEKTEIQKVETNELAKSTVDFGYDVNELNETNQGYFDQFPLQAVIDGNEVVVRSTSDINNELFRGKNLKVVVLNSHSVWSLKDDEGKVICKTYDFPKSKGSFKGSYESYLKNAELRKQLYKRNYYFCLLPELAEKGLIGKGHVVPISTGSSSFKSFNQAVNSLSGARAILFNTYLDFSTVKDKTPTGESYSRPVFNILKDSNGAPAPVVTEKPKFEALLKIRARLKKSHADFVLLSEQLDPMVEDSDEADAPKLGVISDEQIPF